MTGRRILLLLATGSSLRMQVQPSQKPGSPSQSTLTPTAALHSFAEYLRNRGEAWNVLPGASHVAELFNVAFEAVAAAQPVLSREIPAMIPLVKKLTGCVGKQSTGSRHTSATITFEY
jgi:hypothetical protein